MAASFSVSAQTTKFSWERTHPEQKPNVKKTADGNFVGVQVQHAKGDTLPYLRPDGKQATYQPNPKKPDTYPVWQVKKSGRLYVPRVSKTGKPYRQYLQE